MRTLEEQNSLSRYASMTLQMLSHKDEGQMKGWRGHFLIRKGMPLVPLSACFS